MNSEPVAAMTPAFAEMAAEAHRLSSRRIFAEVRRNVEGSMLIIQLGETAEGEGARLAAALKAFRTLRGFDAPFLVVSGGATTVRPTPSVAKDGV